LRIKRSRYGMIGTSPALLRAIAKVEKVASASVSVLFLGESGTGKELFARALHLASPRREKPFIKVNCAAIPAALFESELFGHERGAFTGATDARVGWFEQANGGSIFLDEIGEMPLLLQSKLLRTLQEGTIVRLGGKHEIKIDFRLVAATNRDLKDEVAEGRFREDLFYRLNVIPIELPSLAERRSDIPDLIFHFLGRINQDNQRNVNFSAQAIDYLKRQAWPGNIRQLENVIARIVLLASKSVIDVEDLHNVFVDQRQDTPGTLQRAEPSSRPPGSVTVRPYMRSSSHAPEDLRKALDEAAGNKTRAAQRLGLTERQFSYRWRKGGLDQNSEG
jgi:Nif-specific regulatory protein